MTVTTVTEEVTTTTATATIGTTAITGTIATATINKTVVEDATITKKITSNQNEQGARATTPTPVIITEMKRENKMATC